MFSMPHLLSTEEVISTSHRRRMKTEEKAKVVSAVWGTYLVQFLAALAIWHDNLKKG